MSKRASAEKARPKARMSLKKNPCKGGSAQTIGKQELD
jgi:hypothetical protein